MIKFQNTEYEGCDPWHRDRWHETMPQEFWTPEARRLFVASEISGFFWVGFNDDIYYPGTGVTKAQLAYWCKCASTFLGLDQGTTTCWKPFEKYFNGPGVRWCDRAGNPIDTDKPTPLKSSLHSLKKTKAFQETNSKGYRLDQVGEIDKLFERLYAEQAAPQ